jgi:hypothetical protein
MNETAKANHTPGPWQIDSEDGQWWIYGGGDARATTGIAKCDLIVNAVMGICKQQNVIGQRMPDGEREANARLIAAAPDLLDALREIVDVGAEYYDMDSGENGSPAMAAARAAIAKAEGGAA